jgi:hypothetical protein
LPRNEEAPERAKGVLFHFGQHILSIGALKVNFRRIEEIAAG